MLFHPVRNLGCSLIQMASDSLLSLTLEQQIGQFFYIGLPGTELDAEARALLQEVQPGGVIIFGRNVAGPQQLRDLLDGVRELLPVPPLLGVDQEGGLVDRLRKIFTPMPSARTIREVALRARCWVTTQSICAGCKRPG